MHCKELIYLLEDYLDGTMDPRLKEELDAHIAMCEPCLHFLDTYGKTRILCRQITLDEIPPEFRERLRSFVREKARERRAGMEKYLRKESEERRAQALSFAKGYPAGQLSPAAVRLLEVHRDGCASCGGFFDLLEDGGKGPEMPREVEEHLADLLEDLPPGESPFRS